MRPRYRSLPTVAIHSAVSIVPSPAKSCSQTQQRGMARARTAAIVLTAVLMLVVPAPQAWAQTFKTIHTFSGYPLDGSNPYAGVTESDGNLYGTTSSGGLYAFYGMIFALNADDEETQIYSFNQAGPPVAPVIRDNLGNLYGTLEGDSEGDYGGVFEVDSAGSETTLYSFAGGPTDGCNPTGGLVEYEGDLYGVAGACGANGYGIVYKVSTSGQETVLHHFAGPPTDGAYPSYTSLVVDRDGTFYGITSAGGRWNDGTLYKMTKDGKIALLHSFSGGKRDGCNPHGAPELDERGNLYGASELCGAFDYGTVWQLAKDGKLTILHSFAAGAHDGQYPFVGGVVRDSSGNLYGATQEGGTSDYGVVYKISNKGEFALLHSFRGQDGMYPYGGVSLDSKGMLYGTTYKSGGDDYGTVWSIAP
jgi:uncharacterized repeat protein (TIGR03803 family)